MTTNIRFSNSPQPNNNYQSTGYRATTTSNAYPSGNVVGSTQVRETYNANYNTGVPSQPVRQSYGQPPRIQFGQTGTQPQPVQVRQTYQQQPVYTNQQTVNRTSYGQPEVRYQQRKVGNSPAVTYGKSEDNFLCSRACWIIAAILGLILLTLALLWGLGVFGKSSSTSSSGTSSSLSVASNGQGTNVSTPSGYNNTQPGYAQPVNSQPTYSQPVSTQPSYAPVNTQPAYAQPVNSQPIYSSPSNSYPSYSQPANTY